ncbi:DNA-binding protein [Ralstonia nicotianae]|uniref:DNA-binding protein n=1 Tax=Ralstonia pseudosolanacearum TaxID=1310165 RepID=UPI0020049B3B|nr:DNA-binding protein [Ralstonia pseudosolanacearum]MCK4120415.1 hypothetical protein [Ralstonia pseudosolanacearum]
MARQGISYEQVANVAEQLVADQLKPTLNAVRERLGSGSMNTIHRHLTAWQGHQKPAQRKMSEPNTRLLTALGTEMSRVAEEAAADAEAALAQAMSELAVLAATGEALEAERDELMQQLQQIATERDTLAGKATEQATEIARLQEEVERERNDHAGIRRNLAQAELRLEAVPRLELELAELRAHIVVEQAGRAAADKAEAVADAKRVAAEAAAAQANERLTQAEVREGQARAQLADAHTAHERTRDKLTETVGAAASAQAELKAIRAQIEAMPPAEHDASAGSPPGRAATKRKTPLAGKG